MKGFLLEEVIEWPNFEATYSDEMRRCKGAFVGEDGAKRYEDLQLRVTEHVCFPWLGFHVA